MSYNDYRRRQKRRREEEERAKKRKAQRRAEEHRLRDLQGENLYDFIKGQMPGLPHMTDARRMAADTLIVHMLKHSKSLCADDNYLARWAAANNDLPLLKKLHAHGADMAVYKNYVPRHLAKRGNLPGLVWLRDTAGMDVSPQLEAMMAAAADAHDLPRMDELLRAAPGLSVQRNTSIARAAKAGLLPVLEWYRGHGAVFTENEDEIAYAAIHGGHVPVLGFLRRAGVSFNAGAANAAPQAAAAGHLAVIKWLDDNAVPYDAAQCARQAANNSHTPLVRHLYEKGARLDDHFESLVIWFNDREGNRELSEFLINHRSRRHAHYVTDAFNQALSEHLDPPPRRTITRRLLGKLGLGE